MPVLFMRRLSRGADRLHIVLNSRLFEHVEAMSPDGLDCNVPDDCDLFEALAGNQPPNGARDSRVICCKPLAENRKTG